MVAIAASQEREANNLESLIAAVRQKARAGAGHLTISDLLAAAGRRSYGPLLVLIGLFAISPITMVPGLTFLTTALVLVVAGQMTLGLKRPWMPKKALETKVPEKPLLSFLDKAEPWAKRIDKFLRPRLEFLAAPPFANIVGLLCVAAALITIPLGFVPLMPFFPSLAILLFGLGITAKDGLLLMLGAAAFGGSLAFAGSLLM